MEWEHKMADSLQNPFGSLISQISNLAAQRQSPETAKLQFDLQQKLAQQVREGLATDYLATADFTRSPAQSLRMLGSILNNPDLIRSSLDVQMKTDAFELDKKRLADLQTAIESGDQSRIAGAAAGAGQQGLAIETLEQQGRERRGLALGRAVAGGERGAILEAAGTAGERELLQAGAAQTLLSPEEKGLQSLGLQEKQSLIDQRKQDILESEARIRKMQAEIEGGGRGKPITQTAKANFIRGLKKDVESNVGIKAYKQSARYIGLINTIVDDLNKRISSGESINRIATDQGVINLWNRVQEPGSVTRIEEFRTTAQGEPIVNRLSALIQKIKSGGAGITVESMNEIKRLANIVGKSLTDDANVDVAAYRQIAKETLPDADDDVLNAIARPFSTTDYAQDTGIDEATGSQAAPAANPEADKAKNYIKSLGIPVQ